MNQFKVVSDMIPRGDQPEAINALVRGLNAGLPAQTLLGVTGSGKTFTMAHVIEKVQRPTLVIAHNKTLAGQLAAEFKAFFPENAVEYFVSYYDYYQPEAYIAATDTYIEKDSAINDEIDRLRHSATSSLLERRDVIVVASVSCIYGLGDPEDYKKLMVHLRPGMRKDRDAVINELINIQYNRNDFEAKRGTFRVRGDTLDIYAASSEDIIIRVAFFGDEIEKISEVDRMTGKTLLVRSYASIFPASHYVTTDAKMRQAIISIEEELEARLALLNSQNRLVEAYRLEQRTRYDLEMMRETGFCKGIENYSRHISGRQPGEAPFTLLDFFPDDFLLMIDESHVMVPQIGAMFKGDRSRKETLVEYGFRLPSAFDNRPLRFDEFEQRMGQAVFVSATPGRYEAEHTHQVVEQIIRPTGLVDPQIAIRPVDGQIEDLFSEINAATRRGERSLVLTLTKKMAEDMTDFCREEGMRVEYLHSDIDTVERMKILRDLRQGRFDVLIGINLLREGLDLPEVSLIAILDADQEGFLRSETSLIQIIGRAARNVNGLVVMYADKVTDAMYRAVEETNRRRTIQEAYNEEHHITPTSIRKDVRDVIDTVVEAVSEAGLDESATEDILDNRLDLLGAAELKKLSARLEKEMKQAARDLAFEEAARLRDLLVVIRGRLSTIQ
ncbi:MAG: excinuclease ABC subunit UvrB [Eubacteriales bacterium]|nr:excinuclease ABC subunit UvrB [Eubacteriales bacterium]MDD4462034.1 excinuclease ABC subunit UvrB [Eubacteriales bacterium]